jgi:hypothetical protein
MTRGRGLLKFETNPSILENWASPRSVVDSQWMPVRGTIDASGRWNAMGFPYSAPVSAGLSTLNRVRITSTQMTSSIIAATFDHDPCLEKHEPIATAPLPEK